MFGAKQKVAFFADIFDVLMNYCNRIVVQAVEPVVVFFQFFKDYTAVNFRLEDLSVDLKDSLGMYMLLEDFEQRTEKVKENLQKAHLGWIGILREARDNHVKELWNVNILCYKDVHVLSKFLFCLEMIYKVEEILILDHPKRSPNEQWELLMNLCWKDRVIRLIKSGMQRYDL